MSLPTSFQFIALRRLSANGSRQCRNLHMTGAATFSSPLVMERPASNLPRDLAGLRAECRKRQMNSAGSKQDLMARLSADDLTHSRAFTTAVNASKRPSASNASSTATPVRHFNTTRALKKPGDSSTVDFTYLPDFAASMAAKSAVPTMTNFNFSERKSASVAETPEPTVMRPQISSLSADGAFSPMSDAHDNTSVPIDLAAMAQHVSVTASKATQHAQEFMGEAVEGIVNATSTESAPAENAKEVGTMRHLWNGIVEDVMGPSQNGKVVA